jgi:multidrug efflux system outer membrane protein
MHKRVALLLLAAVAGCGRLAPRHVRPALPTPPEYMSASDSDATVGTPATAIGWREFFPDPRLDALIAAALVHNRNLAISVAQIEQARGLYRIQNADRMPSVDANASATRSRTSALATGVPNAQSVTGNRYAVGVGVPAFELDFWGRVRNLTEAARSRYLATVQAQRAFRLSLIQDVASAYLGAVEAAEEIRVAESAVQSRREGVRIAKVRLDAGITSGLDYHQAETLLTQAEATLASLKLFQAQQNNLLFVLVGGPVPDPLPPPLPLEQQVNPVMLAAGLPSELMLVRPDVIAAEEQLRAAEADVGAARAAFFPSISLTGNLGYASTQLDNLVGQDGLTWSFGPSISLPIFNRGRLTGNSTVAHARQNIAVADYERTIQVAFQEVSNALAGRRFLAEQVAAQERGTIAQRQIAALAATRYREGVVGYIEVLDAERNLFAAEQALLQLRRVEADNLIALYIALGGGGSEQRAAVTR